MSQVYPPPQPPKSDTNVMGLIGLIMSIVGFFTLVSAPIGLVLSLIGLRHPQKGMAIAGVVVGIFSTLYAAAIAVIMLMYFGTLGACCCMAFGMAREQQAQQQAAKVVVAPLLNRSADQIEIKALFVPSFETGAQQASGEAVYTDDAGAKKVVDFTATFEKVNGTWQATNATIDSEPRDWVEFDADSFDSYDEDDEHTDSETEEGDSDDEDVDESPVDEDGNSGDVTFDDDEAFNVDSDAEATPATP